MDRPERLRHAKIEIDNHVGKVRKFYEISWHDIANILQEAVTRYERKVDEERNTV